MYSLIDEVYGVPLLTLDDVFAVTRGYDPIAVGT